MDCDKCEHPLVVYDENDRAKPLRCSDSCPDNRKSLDERGASAPKRRRPKGESLGEI